MDAKSLPLTQHPLSLVAVIVVSWYASSTESASELQRLIPVSQAVSVTDISRHGHHGPPDLPTDYAPARLIDIDSH